jgi:pyrimidine and pyridine-specific 5'-nucleotidase
MSLKQSSTQSETPSRISRHSSTTGVSTIFSKARTISNASLISVDSNATTVTPQSVGGNETQTPSVPPTSFRNKRLSTSIPALTSIRRQSAPVNGLASNSPSASLLSSPPTSTPPSRIISTTQRDSTSLKSSSTVAGSVRTARSNNIFGATDSPSQSTAPLVPSTPRPRVLSLTVPGQRPHLSESPGTNPCTSSPSINLTMTSPQSSRVKSSSRQSSARVIHSKPPSRKSGTVSRANSRSQKHQTGSAPSTISMSRPPSLLDLRQLDGDDDFAGSMSIWDGDDMTIDMLTAADDENVDEEVRTFAVVRMVSMKNPSFSFRMALTRFCQSIRRSSFTTSVSLNGHRQLQQLNSTPYKPRYVSCANASGSVRRAGRCP